MSHCRSDARNFSPFDTPELKSKWCNVEQFIPERCLRTRNKLKGRCQCSAVMEWSFVLPYQLRSFQSLRLEKLCHRTCFALFMVLVAFEYNIMQSNRCEGKWPNLSGLAFTVSCNLPIVSPDSYLINTIEHRGRRGKIFASTVVHLSDFTEPFRKKAYPKNQSISITNQIVLFREKCLVLYYQFHVFYKTRYPTSLGCNGSPKLNIYEF